ncbi:hypothetical protein NDU88_007160 [Pleurodeles waltl]|uniref:Uncharacterized protein n=1 Tax=Pleurodeles waltl TaxID=8319 RepID=A0AAV7U0L6_PLEWA|nr:hypothetical protein NDU88_007160 [Pleurodeles waltl]
MGSAGVRPHISAYHNEFCGPMLQFVSLFNCCIYNIPGRTAAESVAGIAARPGEVLRPVADLRIRVLGWRRSEAQRRQWHGVALRLGGANRLLNEGPRAVAVLGEERPPEEEPLQSGGSGGRRRLPGRRTGRLYDKGAGRGGY